MALEVRRAADRFTTRTGWRTTAHSFSFDEHYDPGNVGHGLLVAHNDDLVDAGAGYATHPHRDVEIVTWVLEGSLVHEDTAGNSGVVHPGLVQRLSAGTGVLHSERNDAPGADRPVRFVQMWVRPAEPGGSPSYTQHDVTPALATGALVPVASGISGRDAAIGLGAPATLHVARLAAGGSARLPDAPYTHLFVATGVLDLEGAGVLLAGDAARLTDDGGRLLTAGHNGAEVLVWEMRPS
jgi:quercetin 2,3-dioxygenase